MQTEFQLTGKKKDGYPSKKTINLYYKEDKTTRPSTIALYVLFIAVVLLAAAKILVFDLTVELNEAQAQVDSKQKYIDEQLLLLEDYKEISSQYSRYSFSYLKDDEIICDRMDVLEMLERTVFLYSTVEYVSISGDMVSINFTGPNLEETASLVRMVEGYPIVEHVTVNTATLDEAYATRMVITLIGAEEAAEEDTTGGEQ